jgi:hypothetical protein
VLFGFPVGHSAISGAVRLAPNAVGTSRCPRKPTHKPTARSGDGCGFAEFVTSLQLPKNTGLSRVELRRRLSGIEIGNKHKDVYLPCNPAIYAAWFIHG